MVKVEMVKDQIDFKRMEVKETLPIGKRVRKRVLEHKVVQETKVDMVVTMEGLAIGEVAKQVPQ